MSDEPKAEAVEEVDPYTLDYDQLKALALAELSGGAVEEPAKEAPVEAATETTEAVTDEPDEIVYRREIDLNDGSGKQVFEGKTPEELIDKLATAQEHATRKIRELVHGKKAEEVKPLTDDEKWLLSQKLMADPLATFDELLERTVGKKSSVLKEDLQRLAEFERQSAESRAAEQFVSAHPEYAATPANGKRLEAYLRTYRLPGTLDNIEKAFQDLAGSGLLDAKKTEAPGGVKTEETTETSRIAKPEDQAVRRTTKVASGLSAKRSAPARTTGPTEDELYSMPLEKLEEIARKEMRDRASQ